MKLCFILIVSLTFHAAFLKVTIQTIYNFEESFWWHWKSYFWTVSSRHMKMNTSVDWMYFAICYFKFIVALGLIIIPGIFLLKPNAIYFLYCHFFTNSELVPSWVLLNLLIETYSMYSSFLVVVFDEIAIFTIHVLYLGLTLSYLKWVYITST